MISKKSQIQKGQKVSRKKAVKILDKVFADYIKLRDGCCVQSTKAEPCKAPLTCGHLITRSNYSTRWDENNAFGQCGSHNMVHEWHPEYFTTWYIDKFGLQTYKLLVIKSRTISKLKTTDLLELAEHYRQKIKELEAIK